MTVLATSSNRFSTVVKFEMEPSQGICRKAVTVNDAAATLKVGAVLGKYIASPTATAGTIVGTGNGVLGTVTMTAVAGLELGTYKIKITKANTNAGDFQLLSPKGKLVGTGTVAVLFTAGGFSFTLADGTTDFALGDVVPVIVAGTEKYKLQDAAAADGSQIASAVLIADSNGNSYDVTLPATTDTTVVALVNGPAIVGQAGLSFGANTTTAGQKAELYAQLESVGIQVANSI